MILTNTLPTTTVLNGVSSTVNTPADVLAPAGYSPVSNGESWIASPSDYQAVASPTFAAAQTIDWTTGGIFLLTLTANVTFTFKNAAIGQSIRLVLTQDGTGSRTGTFPSGSVFVGGSKTLTTTASAVDTVDVQCTAAGTYLCNLLKAYA